MKIFELHFNPRQKNDSTDKIFNTFCYDPKNAYEKKLGALYMAGELKNILPRNLQFLNNLAQLGKNKFYNPTNSWQQTAFENCLKKANDFLSEELSKENTSWLGNLSFSVLSLASQGHMSTQQIAKDPQKQIWKMYFSKIGQIKAFLIRNHEITDLAKEFENNNIEPYPLKVFTKTITGKILFGDKIIVLTKEIADFFNNDKGKNKNQISLLDKLAVTPSLDEKSIREIIKPFQAEITQLSGSLLLIDTTKDQSEINPYGKNSSNILSFKTDLDKFSISDVFKPIIKNALSALPRLKTRKKDKEKPVGNNYSIKTNHLANITPDPKIMPIIIFVALLFIGFLIFQHQERRLSKNSNQLLTLAQEKVLQAESFLKFNNEQKANELFKEALLEIEPLTQDKYIKEEASNLKETTWQNLIKLNKIEIISESSLFLEGSEISSAEKIFFLSGHIYVLSQKTLTQINATSKEIKSYPFKEELKNVSVATPLDDSNSIFINSAGKASIFNGQEFSNVIELKFGNSKPVIDASSYQKNLYLLQSDNIIKCSPPFKENKNTGQSWILPQNKQIQNAKTIAIDSSIYSNQDKTILRYYAGKFEETINISVFPELGNIEKIYTNFNLPYLYIMDESKDRIVISEKNGKVLKQVQIEGIKDFTPSQDGKTLYILAKGKIYQVGI